MRGMGLAEAQLYRVPNATVTRPTPDVEPVFTPGTAVGAPLLQPDRRPSCDARCLDVRAVDPRTSRVVLATLHSLDVHEPVCSRCRLPEDSVVRVGDLAINLATHAVTVDQHEVVITPTEWQILEVLIRAGGRVVTHRELFAQVWPGWEWVEHGRSTYGSRSMIQTIMARMRTKLGDRNTGRHNQPRYRYLLWVSSDGLRLATDRDAAPSS